MRQAREFDIVVYGASGFTGRLVAEYLAGRKGTRAGGSCRAELRPRLGLGAAPRPVTGERRRGVRDPDGARPATPGCLARSQQRRWSSSRDSCLLTRRRGCHVDDVRELQGHLVLLALKIEHELTVVAADELPA